MKVNIEALVDLKGDRSDAESLAKIVKAETGLAATITSGRTGNMANALEAYRIIVRGTSEDNEKAEILLKALRSMMGEYGKNGNHPVVVASSVDPTTPETQAKYQVHRAQSKMQRPDYRQRGRR